MATALIGMILVGSDLLLLSPYLLFALVAIALRTRVWTAFLALLLATTLFGRSAAASSSTGALIFLVLVPAQWVLAVVAAAVPGALDPQKQPQ